MSAAITFLSDISTFPQYVYICGAQAFSLSLQQPLKPHESFHPVHEIVTLLLSSRNHSKCK